MCRGFRISQIFVLIVSVVFPNIFAPTIAFANDTVIATASVVEGEVNYYHPDSESPRLVKLNTIFVEGDRITTGDNSKLKIVFDTGGMISLNSNSDMTIRSLRRDKQGVFSIIFYLGVGILKSSLSKIVHEDLVEYHTKTVVAGIAGTPEHLIYADTTADNIDRTRVYLFGKIGDKGSLYIRGLDPGKTEITLLPHHVTTILAGMAPSVPFILTPALIKSISQVIFRVAPQAMGGGAVKAAVTAGGAVATAGAGASASAAGVSAGTAAAVGGGAAVVGAVVASDKNKKKGGGTTYAVSINLPDNKPAGKSQRQDSNNNNNRDGQSLRDYCRSHEWLTCYHDLANDAQDSTSGDEVGACCKEFEPCTMLVDPTGHPVFENLRRTDCPGYNADNGWECVVCEW